IAGHGARQRLARRRHRAHAERLLEPGLDEAHFVVEPDALLLFEQTDAKLDLALLRFEALFDLPLVGVDVAPELLLLGLARLLEAAVVALEFLFNPTFERVTPEFEQAKLLFDFLFEKVESLQWHRHY